MRSFRRTRLAPFCLLLACGAVPAAEEREGASPLALSWSRETALLATGLAGHLVGQHRLTNMKPAGPEDLRRGDLSPLDRWNAGTWNPGAATASDILVWGVGGAMLYADLYHAARGTASYAPFLEDALILAQAFAWNSALNLNVRAARVHPRPFVYGDAAPARARNKPEAAGSFYSGHASSAFLGAVYVSTVYPLRHPEFGHAEWLWAGSLTAAAGVSALRVTAGKHFPSDVLAGAVVGSLVGAGFVQFHRKGGAWQGWSAVPWFTTDGAPGLAAIRRF